MTDVIEQAMLTYRQKESLSVHNADGSKNKRLQSVINLNTGLITAFYNLRHGDVVTTYTSDDGVGTMVRKTYRVLVYANKYSLSLCNITDQEIIDRMADTEKNFKLGAIRTVANQLQNNLLYSTSFGQLASYNPLSYAVNRAPSANCGFPEIYVVQTENRTTRMNAITSSVNFDESGKLVKGRVYGAVEQTIAKDEMSVLCEDTGSSLKHVYYCYSEEQYNKVIKFIEKELSVGKFEYTKQSGGKQHTYRITGQSIG